MLADLRLEGGAGTCSPPSVKPGPQVTPGLGELYLLRLTKEFDVLFFSNASPSIPASDCDSLIVLEGDPGVGGVFDRDDLRVENVKLVAGRLFDPWDVVALVCDVPFVSMGAYWSTILFIWGLLLLRKLLVLVKRPGLFSFSLFDGDADDSMEVDFCAMLALLLTRRLRGGGG